METLMDLYNEYKEIVEEPVDYEYWIYEGFGADLDNNFSDYEKCLHYNEYADKNGHYMWDNIESLNEYGDFLRTYDIINHDRFDTQDDIIIEENNSIVSYTYSDFVEEYWDIDKIITFIEVTGLENLINYDIIIDKVNMM